MKINLQRSFFDTTEREFISYGKFTVKTLKYPSGVEALIVSNPRTEFVFTPFKGQQVWHFKVDGKEISMKTQVEEPQASNVYLENYGGFLYHCGVTSFGVPDAIHPQHGEIPNAQYGTAYIDCGEDSDGKYIIIGGSLEHNTAFIRHYRFSPELKIYEDGTVLYLKVKLENLRSYPMEYMYLCHINFRPIEGAELLTSARVDSEHMKIYKTEISDELTAYINALEKDITKMFTVDSKTQCYDPELCFGITHDCDENGMAYTMQNSNGGAYYVAHPTAALPYSIRWISRTKNEDSMGMVLPCTAEHLGYEHAKANGQLKILAPDATLEFNMEAGYLDPERALKVKEKIEKINSKNK